VSFAWRKPFIIFASPEPSVKGTVYIEGALQVMDAVVVLPSAAKSDESGLVPFVRPVALFQ
jgi:hypothetical protein